MRGISRVGRSRTVITRLFVLSIALSCGGLGVAQEARPAVPQDPIPEILDAFRTHPIVALSEGTHNNEQGYACGSP